MLEAETKTISFFVCITYYIIMYRENTDLLVRGNVLWLAVIFTSRTALLPNSGELCTDGTVGFSKRKHGSDMVLGKAPSELPQTFHCSRNIKVKHEME